MKAIKYIESLIIGILVVSLTTSCDFVTDPDKFLDQVPDERVEVINLEQVIMLLGSAYSAANYGWLCEASSDNIVDVNAPYYATQSNGSEVLVHYNLNSYSRMDDEIYKFEPVRSSTDSDSPSSIWENCYQAIATVNHALAVLDTLKAQANGDMSEEMKAAYGEAYLSRAYHHFILVNIFSQAYKSEELSKNDVGIPYVKEAEDVVLKNYDRSTVTETYKKIQEDLELGLTYVSDVNYKMPKWHFNINAAHAFAARFYLYKRDYDKVIEHADVVLGTDPAALNDKLMDYTHFDECTSSTDYAEIWQGPSQANNLMLMATYSIQWRRQIGRRYACAGKALRDIEFHLGPNWRWYLMPTAGVSGGTFWDGTSDHGFTSARIAERFEYTDKVAGIGYAHVIRREFTATELLLERAEAKLLKANSDVEGFIEDILAYDNNRFTFSESNNLFYRSSNALVDLTRETIESYYVRTSNSNVYADWNFTQKMDPNFVIDADKVVYMNCLNDMRRFETAYTGLRFFDLKRFGIEYTHVYGVDGEGVDYFLGSTDPRRAIEAPQEVLAAGLEPSQPTANTSGGSSLTSKSTDFQKQ
ncbi:MAG: RagB/SusD family nutrient uptake outer membrane protein [Phocaeicola sp.]|nr:RagB/SusD family nutrient uptake outer membrane protein [Phocaeicola sp.]